MFVINRSLCACCHNCASDCPMQAIDFVGTKYQIDQDRCVQCGLCAKLCHTGACHEVPETPAVVSQHDPIHLNCDVVVVGTGSGLVSAVRAAQAGKKVIVLEKSHKLGGNTDFAHGYMVTYSDWHEKLGIPDEREGAVKAFSQRCDGEIDESLLRSAVYGTCDFFNWLCTLCDITKTYTLKKATDTDFHGPMFGQGVLEMSDRQFENLLCRDDAIGPGWGGTHVKHTMLDAIEKDNLPVKILTSTAAKHLELDNDGKISGVIAQDPGGEVRIKCKSVICSSGSYTHNDELLRRFIPWFFPDEKENPNCEHVHRFAAPTDTGDVVELGESCRAYVDYDAFCINLFGPVHHPFTFAGFFAQMSGNQMTVNLKGKRFYNEGAMGGGSAPICFQPRRMVYTIYDTPTLEETMEEGIRTRGGIEGEYLKRWKQDFQEELDSHNGVSLFVADTLEELAEQAGIEKEPFLQEVAHYNEMCKNGVDEDFGKNARNLKPIVQGPFYAIFGKMATDGAFGGVLVNPKCEVYRADKQGVIPGLYAAGDNASGVQANAGKPGDYRMKAFTDYQWAVDGGYLSAQSCAEYLTK